ncbi:hypothetical protein Ae201684P_005547 [Aphanomyces euteiches]|nr:hypothetical protein Ae201684P_005547 [Aphanomyces euteiches]
MAIDQRFTTLAVASVATVGCGYLVYRLLYRQEESSQKTALEDMEHQVGGHACMKLYRGHVLKPFQSKNRGERELAFYESVPTDVPFVPAFYGVIRLPSTDEDGPRRYLQIKNLLGGMIHPCIMDVKVGTKSYEPTASRDKIALEIAKCPLQATMGFRLQGIKVYWDSKQEHVSYDKYFFRDLATAESIEAAFVKYFEAGPDHVPRYYLLEPPSCMPFASGSMSRRTFTSLRARFCSSTMQIQRTSALCATFASLTLLTFSWIKPPVMKTFSLASTTSLAYSSGSWNPLQV